MSVIPPEDTGKHPEYRASTDFLQGSLSSSNMYEKGKIGGEIGSSPVRYIINEIETDISGDSVTFGFYSQKYNPLSSLLNGNFLIS